MFDIGDKVYSIHTFHTGRIIGANDDGTAFLIKTGWDGNLTFAPDQLELIQKQDCHWTHNGVNMHYVDCIHQEVK